MSEAARAPGTMSPVQRPERDEAVKLLERVLHLRMNGERAPGGDETWPPLDRDIEAYLRSLLPPRDGRRSRQGDLDQAAGSLTASAFRRRRRNSASIQAAPCRCTRGFLSGKLSTANSPNSSRAAAS